MLNFEPSYLSKDSYRSDAIKITEQLYSKFAIYIDYLLPVRGDLLRAIIRIMVFAWESLISGVARLRNANRSVGELKTGGP